MIRVDVAYDAGDEHLDTHVSILKQSGAEVFVFAGQPENAAKVIRIAAEHDWHPVFIVNQTASSIATVMKPAGLQNAAGVVTAAFLKDASDPAWKDQAAKDWPAFLDKYAKAGGKDDSAAMYGYAAAATLIQVLKQCGNDLSRENVMKQAETLTISNPRCCCLASRSTPDNGIFARSNSCGWSSSTVTPGSRSATCSTRLSRMKRGSSRGGFISPRRGEVIRACGKSISTQTSSSLIRLSPHWRIWLRQALQPQLPESAGWRSSRRQA